MSETRQHVAIGRRFGASPAALERMRQSDAEEVWIARCRLCYAPLKGTLEQIRAHECTVPRDGK